MNPDRWSVTQTGITEITVTFKPSDHHDYLVEKAPEAGDATGSISNRLTPTLGAEIEALMRDAMEK